jgi:hypothetical protein
MLRGLGLLLISSVLTAPAGSAQSRVLGAVERAAAAHGAETLLEAVAAARLTLHANLAGIVLLRLDPDAPMALQIDVRAMLRGGDTSMNVRLADHDLVFVPSGAGGDPIGEALEAAARSSRVPRDAWLCLRAQHAGSGEVRARAVRELCDLRTIGAGVVPILRTLLADPEPAVIREAVTALGTLGPRARAAAGELRELCDHGDAQIRLRAQAALDRVSDAEP